MKLSYPIGGRGEAVYYTISTTTYNCAKALMQLFSSDNPTLTQLEDEYYVEVDAYAHDVVRLVESVEMNCDDKASVGYVIMDTETQDWEAELMFEKNVLVKVDENPIEI